MINRFLAQIAMVLQVLAFLAAGVGLFVLYVMFSGMAAGGQPEVISMVFAIGLAVIPYCFAGSFQRTLVIQHHLDAQNRS